MISEFLSDGVTSYGDTNDYSESKSESGENFELASMLVPHRSMDNVYEYNKLSSKSADSTWNDLHFALKTELSEQELSALLPSETFEIEGKVDFLPIYHVRFVGPPSSYMEQSLTRRGIESLNRIPVEELEKLNKIIGADSVTFQKRLHVRKRASLSRLFEEIATKDEELESKSDELQNHDQKYAAAVKKRAQKLKKALSFNDPLSKGIWQYLNDGSQPNVSVGLDLNIYPAYLAGYTGEGVTVSILDDGLDTTHEDLARNYDASISVNMNSPNTQGLSPRGPKAIMSRDETHGTECAGLVAAVANNYLCSHGIAFNARIGGVRMLAGQVTDILEARGITYRAPHVSIYSASWGPKDDGIMMDGPRNLAIQGFKYGVSKGRSGLGSIYMYAAGNGGFFSDSCGADGFVNSPYVITVNAVNGVGKRPQFSESCSAIRISVPVGDINRKQHTLLGGLPTTHINDECLLEFVGTSPANPLAAGCISLALEANANLTWRDVKHLVTWSSRLPHAQNPEWQMNAAGLTYNPTFGFGLLDCSRMVWISEHWQNVGPLCIVNRKWGQLQKPKWAERQSDNLLECDLLPCLRKLESLKTHKEGLAIQANQETVVHFVVNKPKGLTDFAEQQQFLSGQRCEVERVEEIVVRIEWDHICRGALSFYLESPSGSVGKLLEPRKLDKYNGEGRMELTSLAHWGEPIKGKWTFKVQDNGHCGESEEVSKTGTVRGYLVYVGLSFWGTDVKRSGYTLNKSILDRWMTPLSKETITHGKTRNLSESDLYDIYNQQRWTALHEPSEWRKFYE